MATAKRSAKWRNDLILVAVILIVAVICFLVFRLNLRDGKSVNISVNGEVMHSFGLDSDLEKTVATEHGKNVIVIKDGAVTVRSADCPDKICVEHRAISKAGETIVCLPHKVVVEIAEEG